MTHGVSANTSWCGLRDAAGSISYSGDEEYVDCIDCLRSRVRDLSEQVDYWMGKEQRLSKSLEQIAGAPKGNLRNPAKIARAALQGGGE